MESRPQNPEFRNNPENFHPCKLACSFSDDSNSLHICANLIKMLDPWLSIERPLKTDQTAWMCRLI